MGGLHLGVEDWLCCFVVMLLKLIDSALHGLMIHAVLPWSFEFLIKRLSMSEERAVIRLGCEVGFSNMEQHTLEHEIRHLRK